MLNKKIFQTSLIGLSVLMLDTNLCLAQSSLPSCGYELQDNGNDQFQCHCYLNYNNIQWSVLTAQFTGYKKHQTQCTQDCDAWKNTLTMPNSNLKFRACQWTWDSIYPG